MVGELHDAAERPDADAAVLVKIGPLGMSALVDMTTSLVADGIASAATVVRERAMQAVDQALVEIQASTTPRGIGRI